MPPLVDGLPGACVATFLFSLAGSLVPILSIEAFLLAVGAARPCVAILLLPAAATLGQMAGKSLVYRSGAGLLRLPLPGSVRVRDAMSRLSGSKLGPTAFVLASALTGLPPFYAVSLAAGALGVPFGRFMAAGSCGALLRFTTLLALASLVTS